MPICNNKDKIIAELTSAVADDIYNNTIAELEKVADSENNFYITALESIDDSVNQFKNFIYFALKEVFNCRELDILLESSSNSRNYLIAYSKLAAFFRRTLTPEDRASIHMTYNEMLAIVFEYMSRDYVEMLSPEEEEDRKNNTVNPKKTYTDYNAIDEMFI